MGEQKRNEDRDDNSTGGDRIVPAITNLIRESAHTRRYRCKGDRSFPRWFIRLLAGCVQGSVLGTWITRVWLAIAWLLSSGF